ncbi:MAG TPA: hypothetical protein VJJ98_03725 [Sedimentisphaerales bacterium]|nr:hypothetical protein [Sedimentisphaerales bacterium]
MSEQQAISTGLEALKLIAAGGIGGAVASCIGNWFVNKKLQAQKHEHDKQLESLKSKLGKKNTVHKLQFEKEFQLYGELWKALVDVRSTATITPSVDIMPKDQAHYDVYKGRFESAADAFNKANDLFKYHRPFYHDDVSKITEDLLDQCRKHIRKVARVLSSGKFDDKLFDSADELFEKMTEAINKIEEAIKRRIGLLHEAEIVE